MAAPAAALLSILLVCLPDHGHLHPFLQLAAQLQASAAPGALRVQLASLEDARARVEARGVGFVSLGARSASEAEEYERRTRVMFDPQHSALQKMRVGASAVIELSGIKMGASLLEHLRQANATGRLPDLLVTDGLTTAGFDAAEAWRLPLSVVWPFPLTVALEVSGYSSCNMAWHVPFESMALCLSEKAIERPLVRWVANPLLKKAHQLAGRWTFLRLRNRVRAQLGLPPLQAPLLRRAHDGRPSEAAAAALATEPGPFAVQPAVPRALYVAGLAWELNTKRELPPAWHMVGPLGISDWANFPPPLQDAALGAFLDDAQGAGEPVLLAAAGTMVQLQAWQVQAMAAAFSALAQEGVRVLWALKPASQALLPPDLQHCSNGSANPIMVVNWLEQSAALGHPQVKAFLSHGGLGSVHEAVALGKPTLVVPFSGSADHVMMGQQLVNRGLGSLLHVSELGKPGRLHAALHELLAQPEFQRRAAAVAAAWRSRADGAGRAAKLILDFAAAA